MQVGRRLGAWKGGSGELPFDYFVEFIENDGTSYVDTGVCFGNERIVDMRFVAHCSFYCHEHAGSLRRAFGFGSTAIYSFYTHISNTDFYSFKLATSTNSTSTICGVGNISHDIDIVRKSNYSECKIDGQTKFNVSSGYEGSTAKDVNCVLFGYSYGNVSATIKPSIAGCRIECFSINNLNTGKAVDLVPVVKDGIAYFYDKISGNLLGNSNPNGGTLIAGPVI